MLLTELQHGLAFVLLEVVVKCSSQRCLRIGDGTHGAMRGVKSALCSVDGGQTHLIAEDRVNRNVVGDVAQTRGMQFPFPQRI